MDPIIKAELRGSVLILEALLPTIDARNSKTFRAEVEKAADGKQNVVLNLSKVEFMDSSALGSLIPLLREFSGKGGDLRLCNLGPKIQVLFEITRLYRVFSIWPNVEAAVGSFEKAA